MTQCKCRTENAAVAVRERRQVEAGLAEGDHICTETEDGWVEGRVKNKMYRQRRRGDPKTSQCKYTIDVGNDQGYMVGYKEEECLHQLKWWRVDNDEDSSSEGASQSESGDEGSEKAQTARGERKTKKQSEAENWTSQQGVCRHRIQEMAHSPSIHAATEEEALDNAEGEWIVAVITGEVRLGHVQGIEGNTVKVELMRANADKTMRDKIAKTGEVSMWKKGDVKLRQIWERRQHGDRRTMPPLCQNRRCGM